MASVPAAMAVTRLANERRRVGHGSDDRPSRRDERLQRGEGDAGRDRHDEGLGRSRLGDLGEHADHVSRLHGDQHGSGVLDRVAGAIVYDQPGERRREIGPTGCHDLDDGAARRSGWPPWRSPPTRASPIRPPPTSASVAVMGREGTRNGPEEPIGALRTSPNGVIVLHLGPRRWLFRRGWRAPAGTADGNLALRVPADKRPRDVCPIGGDPAVPGSPRTVPEQPGNSPGAVPVRRRRRPTLDVRAGRRGTTGHNDSVDGESVADDSVEGSTQRRDVLVIGGGPAGASAAYWLASAGHRVLVVEKKRFPREKTCGDGLTPRAVHQLEAMGLGPALEPFHRYEGLRAVAHGITLELTWPEHPVYPSHGYVVRRRDLDRLVAERAVVAGADDAGRMPRRWRPSSRTGCSPGRWSSARTAARSRRFAPGTWSWPTGPTPASDGRSGPNAIAAP